MRNNEDFYMPNTQQLPSDGQRSMEVKSSKKLDDLPVSTDEFWAEAEVHTFVVHDWFQDHLHYFERTAGHQAYCSGCGWGFQLDPGDKIIDGHLYDKKGKFVI